MATLGPVGAKLPPAKPRPEDWVVVLRGTGTGKDNDMTHPQEQRRQAHLAELERHREAALPYCQTICPKCKRTGCVEVETTVTCKCGEILDMPEPEWYTACCQVPVEDDNTCCPACTRNFYVVDAATAIRRLHNKRALDCEARNKDGQRRVQDHDRMRAAREKILTVMDEGSIPGFCADTLSDARAELRTKD